MADRTPIEWADATWNPIVGCSVVSPGCTHCYAMRLAGTRLKNHPSRVGLTIPGRAGPVWNGQVRFNEGSLLQPLAWRRPRKIFVCAHGDLFHEAVPDAWIDRVFAVMALAPQHTFQVLTKRSARMRAYCTHRDVAHRIAMACGALMTAGHDPRRNYERAVRHPQDADGWLDPILWNWPLPKVWLGVSAEDQRRADERVPDLLATPAAVRFASAEPLLSEIDFRRITVRVAGEPAAWAHYIDALTGEIWDDENGTIEGALAPGEQAKLDQIIAGDESGRDRRVIGLDAVRSIRDQCAATGTAFFLKQLHIDGRKVGLPALDGVTHCAFPAHHQLIPRGFALTSGKAAP